MTPYKNLSGSSNVEAFEIGAGSITVRFRTGAQRNYLYDHLRPGSLAVQKMVSLAQQGHGLNSYISTTVKSNFSRKW